MTKNRFPSSVPPASGLVRPNTSTKHTPLFWQVVCGAVGVLAAGGFIAGRLNPPHTEAKGSSGDPKPTATSTHTGKPNASPKPKPIPSTVHTAGKIATGSITDRVFAAASVISAGGTPPVISYKGMSVVWLKGDAAKAREQAVVDEAMKTMTAGAAARACASAMLSAVVKGDAAPMQQASTYLLNARDGKTVTQSDGSTLYPAGETLTAIVGCQQATIKYINANLDTAVPIYSGTSS